MSGSFGRLEELAHTLLAHTPTLSGLAFGGNEDRQIEFYLGEVLSQVTGMTIVSGQRRDRKLDCSRSLLFVHTGGTAAIFSYGPLLLDEPV